MSAAPTTKSSSEAVHSARPTVSVCMASYNGERFIARQIETILSQLGEADELVISDDSSTDATLFIVRSFGDPRIAVLPGQTFRSPCFNLENALRHARGDVIVISDQDDEWLEGRLESALEGLKRFSLVVCDAEIIDAEGRSTGRDLSQIYSPRTGFITNLFRNRYLGCCMAFRREVLEKALPIPSNLPWHDWWLGLIAEIYFSTAFLDKKLVRYRRHGGNASRIGEKSGHGWNRRLEVRWRTMKELARRYLSLRTGFSF